VRFEIEVWIELDDWLRLLYLSVECEWLAIRHNQPRRSWTALYLIHRIQMPSIGNRGGDPYGEN